MRVYFLLTAAIRRIALVPRQERRDMVRILAAIMVTALGAQAVPALAETVPSNASVPAEAEMPFTEQFASALTRYRNCVLKQVDKQAPGDKSQMVNEAMSACVLSRVELQEQLAADIRASSPVHSEEAALSQAEGALTGIDPMIEAAAAEHTSIVYARVMI